MARGTKAPPRKIGERSSREHPIVTAAKATKHPLALCQPRDDRLVVRRIGSKTETKGGILLPDSAQPKENIGHVIVLGPGNRTPSGEYIPIEVTPGVKLEPGDKVILTSFAGMELRGVDRKDDDFFILRAEDVLAKLPPDEED